MTAGHPRLLAPAVLDWQGGTPVSRCSGDIYFSRDDGVAESRSVFLDGNDLPARFAAVSRGPNGQFCIGETGFGTGLNFLLARRAFLAAAAEDAQLDFVSVERAPVAADDLRHCAAALAGNGHDGPARDMRELAERVPPPLGGWHRLLFDGGRVRLSLWFGDALAGFTDWSSQRQAAPHARGVNAWFLDGFAPRLGPELWSPELCARLAQLSAPDATLGTFTVARTAREALQAAGFFVERVAGAPSRDGRGGKRQILRGCLSQDAPTQRTQPGAHSRDTADAMTLAGARDTEWASAAQRPRSEAPVLVVGAGLAGACAAAALARRGRRVLVIDAVAPAAGASGNPWAVLHPRLPMDDGPRAPWLLTAHHFAAAMLDGLGEDAGWQSAPVVQIAEARRPKRLARLLDRFAALAPLLGATEFAGAPALLQRRGGHADLPRLIRALLDHALIETHDATAIAGIERQPRGWCLTPASIQGKALEDLLEQGQLFEQVVLATGAETPVLLPGLPIGRMRGQVTRVRTATAPRSMGAPAVLTGRGHAIALEDGWVCGSSYVRDGAAGPPTAAERDDNLERLAAWLRDLHVAKHADDEHQGQLAGTPTVADVIEEFSGVRATVPDRAPLVGSLESGLWLTCGHASSGLTTCPLAGEYLAAALCGEPPVLDAELIAMLDPKRYLGAGGDAPAATRTGER